METETRRGNEIITTLTETLLEYEWKEKITETRRLVRQEDGEDKEDDGPGQRVTGNLTGKMRGAKTELTHLIRRNSEDITPGR